MSSYADKCDRPSRVIVWTEAEEIVTEPSRVVDKKIPDPAQRNPTK